MTSSKPDETLRPAAVLTPRPVIGLRERKKARTRAAIRAQAIRMFAAQGYAATTVEQIAEAADISPSTFFRYFPTKEAVVVTDEWDPLIIESFRSQPPELTVIQAFRRAIRESFVQTPLTEEELQEQRLRHSLLHTEPELRSAMLEEFVASFDLFSGLIAERVGRSTADFKIRTLAGALMGTAMSVTLNNWGHNSEDLDLTEMIDQFDAAMELLELGLPL